MPASPIRKLVPLARSRPAHGHQDLPPEHQPARPAVAADRARRPEKDRPYGSRIQPQRRDIASLRETGRLLRTVQIKLSPDDIIVTTGGSRPCCAFMSCLNPRRRIIVPRAGLRQLHGLRHLRRGRDTPVVSSIEQGFALPDVAEFEKLINDHARYPDLQSQQPHGVPIHPQGDGPHPRPGQKIRPVPLLRRGLPRVHLHRVALPYRPAISKASSKTWC